MQLVLIYLEIGNLQLSSLWSRVVRVRKSQGWSVGLSRTSLRSFTGRYAMITNSRASESTAYFLLISRTAIRCGDTNRRADRRIRNVPTFRSGHRGFAPVVIVSNESYYRLPIHRDSTVVFDSVIL